MLTGKGKKLHKNIDTVNVLMNIMMGFLVKGGSMFIALFTTSSYITYFSNDGVLGVWFTLLSILAWILNFDMGIGNGVRNKLVITFENDDREESKKYISSAYIFLIAMSVIILIVGVVAIPLLSWNSILGVDTANISKELLTKTVIIVFVSIILQFVFRLITSIAYAMQKSYVAALLNLCTNTILLLYVVVANMVDEKGDIIKLAVVYLLAVNLPLLITTFVFFLTKLKDMRPNFRFFSMSHAQSTFKLGGAFLYLQIIGMLLANTANFLISNLLGSDQVVEYQLYYKLFHLVCTIISLAIVPMWSAITKALCEKRYVWLKKAIYLMFSLVGVTFVIEFIMVPMLPFLFKIWLRENVRTISYSTGLIFAIFGGMATWTQVCSYIANGLGKIKIEAITLTVGVIISFTFSIIFANIWGSYLAITVGTILGYIPFCVLQTIWTFRFCKSLKESDNDSDD